MITLVPDEEQTEFVASVKEYYSRRLPLSRVRAAAGDTSRVDELWREYADLGWLGLTADDAVGGIGLGVIEETLFMTEAGRHLAPGPLRSTLLAVRLASDEGDNALAGRLVSGDLRVGLAVGDRIIDAGPGDAYLVLTEYGTTLAELVAGDTLTPTDPGVRLTRATASRVLMETERSYASRARLLASAELLGVLEAVRDMSAEYAKLRVAFGKPIGAYQAVKHRCADMAIGAFALRAQVGFAAVHFDARATDADLQVDMAYDIASWRAVDAAKDNILNHGGIGFTWEADPHLYLKRAALLGRLYGTERERLNRIYESDSAAELYTRERSAAPASTEDGGHRAV